MLETYNNGDIVVTDYTDNFSIKSYIVDKKIPEAFPDVSMNKLNLGFTGIVSDLLGNLVEDAFYTSSLMLNENFITKAILPNSIYSEAGLFDIGYTFATPSRCNFAVQLWAEDIIKYSKQVSGSNIYQYKLDKNTRVILGDISYVLDYDIIIAHKYINGNAVFETYYDLDSANEISIVNNRYIKHKVSNNGWVVLFLTLQEYSRKTVLQAVTDNIITTNADLKLQWTKQIAGFDLTYINPSGERLPMKKKIKYSDPQLSPFVFYSFTDDNTIVMNFSVVKNFFKPEFNSKIEAVIYTCNGKSSNFDSYNPKAKVAVDKSSERFEYNVNTRIVAACYSGSLYGSDKKDIEMLRDDVKVAYNTVKVLSTDHDLDEWFNNFAKRYDTKAYFFKRRDDPSGRLFSQFIAITDNNYIYPTNTLTIEVGSEQFDFIIDNNEYIIKPGHCWEYKKLSDGSFSRDTVQMIPGITTETSIITDPVIPQITTDRPFMFVNPFYLKFNRVPQISAVYNYLIDDTSYPFESYINDDILTHFQISSFHVSRTINRTHPNDYIFTLICSPVVAASLIYDDFKYVEDTYENSPDLSLNNLRLILVLKSKKYGETGYIEMRPKLISTEGNIEFEAIITVYDELKNDNTIFVDLSKTPGVHSLLTDGPNVGKVLLDTTDTMLDMICVMKDVSGSTSPTGLFGDPAYNDYLITNRFYNDFRSLVLYKPMTMMKSTLTFAGTVDDYTLQASLIPFIKYNIVLDESKMSYFINAFSTQYKVIEPVLFERLDNNSHIDLKLFNTYGFSRNYMYEDKSLLPSVSIKVHFALSVVDRTMYTATAESVKVQIKEYFEGLNLNNNKQDNVYISNLIKLIESSNPNVHHLKFISINERDANDQYILNKLETPDVSFLTENELFGYVPEIIICDIDDISITEDSL